MDLNDTGGPSLWSPSGEEPVTEATVGVSLDQRTLTETIEIIILTACFLIGAPLNIRSIWKLARLYPSMGAKCSRSAAACNSQINLLRFHLNIADLMTLFIYTTAQIAWLTTVEWFGGDILCRVIKFFYTFVFYLTSFIIVSIAMDRVYSAFKLRKIFAFSNFKASLRAQRRCRTMIAGAWVAATVLSLPQLYIFGVSTPYDMPGFQQCVPIWMSIRSELAHRLENLSITDEERIKILEEYHDSTRWEFAYNISHILFVFWIPALAILASYATILCILNSITRQKREVLEDFRFSSSLFSIIFTASRLVVGRDHSFSERQTEGAQDEESGIGSFGSGHGGGGGVSGFPKSSVDQPSLNGTPSAGKAVFAAKVESELSKTEESVSLIHKSSVPHSHGRLSLCEVAGARPSVPSGRKKGGGLHATAAAARDRSLSRVGPMAIKTIAVARAKTKRQAALILLAYLTLWTPYNILSILNTFVPHESRGPIMHLCQKTLPFLNSLIVVNAIVNPLIYQAYDS